MRRPARSLVIALVAATLVAVAHPAGAETSNGASTRQKGEQEPGPQPDLPAAVAAELDAAIGALRADGDFDAAQSRIDALLDRAISYLPASEETIFRDIAFTRRLMRLLADVDTRQTLLAFLLDHPRFARALVFAMHPEHDNPSDVFALVERLRQERGPHLDKFATLAAAICVVHDEPKPMRVNENKAKPPDPIAVFDFYAGNRRRMLFGVRDVPTELLVYVVDVSASIDEMKWALHKYAGDRNVGSRFFDIKYDYDHLTRGTTKDVTAAGWSLPNILKYGGICADQAYFAVTVGKSIGVPATYTVGTSARSAHAWVGFLQTDRKLAWWNFNSGRYRDYQNARGMVIDPQTREIVPDSTVSLLAAHVRSAVADREYAAAMTDASQRLAETRGGGPFVTTPFAAATGEPLRTPTLDDAIDLLETGLRQSPGYAAGWLSLQSLSRADDFTAAHRREWGTFLHKLCGCKYQDFYLRIVSEMIASIDDSKEQNRFWNTAFETFSNRPDLAASVRLSQGRMWMKHDQLERAGRCFEDVIVRYANAGPFVVDALTHAAGILRQQRDGRRLIALYRTTWNRTRRPREAWSRQFATQSNWSRVGDAYATVLDETGRGEDANRVRAEIRKTSR